MTDETGKLLQAVVADPQYKVSPAFRDASSRLVDEVRGLLDTIERLTAERDHALAGRKRANNRADDLYVRHKAAEADAAALREALQGISDFGRRHFGNGHSCQVRADDALLGAHR